MKSSIIFAIATTTLVSVLALGSASAQKTYRAPFLGTDDIIQGLGDRVPTSENVSLSDNFRVYKFEKSGITFVQINTLDDEVLTAVGLTRQGSFVLSIGKLSANQVMLPSHGDSASAGNFATTAQCPCSAQVVYQDAYATIVVVYGVNGDVIQVVVIYHDQGGPIEP